jgi:outer membrane protein insertion porin family
MHKFISFPVFIFLFFNSYSQSGADSTIIKTIDYSKTREYVIADIKVTGVRYLQPGNLLTISGLYKGMKIQLPGTEISEAIKKYWKYGLFSDVKILITKIEDGNIYLEIQLREQPRLNKIEITGIKKSDKDDIQEKIDLKRGMQITDDNLNRAVIIIKKHFKEKGFFNVTVDIKQAADTSGSNLVNLHLDIQKNNRVRIKSIDFEGNTAFTDARLRRKMKKTKERNWNIFHASKYIESDYKEDKKKLIEFYNKNGYRDAKILNEELVPLTSRRIGLKITLFEGDIFYIHNIRWIGNTKYPAEYLNIVLGMKPGDIYDKKQLDDRLRVDEDAVTTLYMDDGYLFFSVNPVESRVENDSVDLELQIYEGKQATLNNIFIKGNTKTNEHVARRELYTRPGELFSKTDIIRSVRQLANLGHFNPETINPTPIPNQSDGTVDIDYSLEERANDQLELSGGWGGYYGFMGTVKVKFSNFAIGRFFDLSSWKPVPSGDGQTLQLGVQSSGKQYQGYNITFVEPWFGGKKPNSLSLSLFHTRRHYIYSNSLDSLNSYWRTTGASVGLGKRLKWPDDYFSLYNEVAYQQYHLHNWPQGLIRTGRNNLLSYKITLSRSSQDQMIYPRKGSSLSLSLQLTPPYSLFNDKDYSTLSNEEKYKYVEFYKWTFSGDWFTSLIQNLVLALHTQFGFLGAYNKTLGPPPFEKFYVGGDGMSGYDMYGTDVIAVRGYDEGVLTPMKRELVNGSYQSIEDGNIYTRYWAELRYPVSLKPAATIYGLLFIEGANCWSSWDTFNPFSNKRAAGVGVRAFLPMFGMLGVDWGYGFDKIGGKVAGGKWSFVLGQQF